MKNSQNLKKNAQNFKKKNAQKFTKFLEKNCT